jgi:hypothetical protein
MTPPRWMWLAGTVLLLAVSYGMGRRSSTPAEADSPVEAGAPAAVRSIVIERSDTPGGIDREELRAVVREELARNAEEHAGEEDPAREPADPAREARVTQAVAAAVAAIESGIVDGLWDARDREKLREQLPFLGERETHAVLSPLFQAVNAQRVKLDGPPI